jgi:asparagine synthase (glutamine-hydrolysing)
MCGIAGAVTAQGAVEPAAVVRMCDTMDHRGPDSRGLFSDDGVALGVARLAVIDVEGGDQPIASEDGAVVVVCNGEIYNYRELRAELARRGHRFSTESDVEVIVHLYEELGDDCVRRLRGMFAFALWDRRARRLMLARDRAGKKPLFYASRGDRLWFASEPRALLASEAVPREVDYEAVDLFLHYQSVPAPRSAFAAMRKLRPAHALSWRDGTESIRRYWRLSYRDEDPPPGEAEACERIRDALLEATRLRLRSDVPVGALLSGGVDSGAVVAAMARSSTGRIKTFSIGFDVPAFDETTYAREVAQRYGTDHHELVLDESALDLVPRLVWHYGEPFADSSALATFVLSELASRHVTVALNGDGGDEAFCGYERYGRQLPSAPSEREYAERRAKGYFDEGRRAELYSPEFADSVAGQDWRAPVEESYYACDSVSPRERMAAVDTEMYLPDDLLVKMDIAAMAHSLEARSPFCDTNVMELAASLPIELKVRPDNPKALLKQAVAPWLPLRAIERPKMGFMIPMDEWLAGSRAAEVILDRRALDRGIFRRDRLEAMVEEWRAGAGRHAYRMWTLMMLELWFQTYIDRSAVETPIAA